MNHVTCRPRLPRGLLAALAAALLAALAVACGGGVGSGGTGAPVARSTASGTVTGFGSLLLDGVRYDDSGARVVAEVAPGDIVNAPLALGHSVELEIEGEGRAATVSVDARLVGPVTAVGPGARFTALGQTVQVNADANAGPVTLFGSPLAGLGALAAGDIVEVHGVVRSAAGGDVIQATRIERRSVRPAQWRVVGRVAGVGGAAFSIGALTVDRGTATLLPAGAALAEGQQVAVFGSSVAGDASRLRATQVRIYQRASADALDAQVGGIVDALAGSTFRVNGVSVDAGAAQVTPASRTLAEGAYVQVRGAYRSSDGVLVASRVQIRNVADAPAIELAGTVVDLDAAAATLRIRDTLVSTAGARLQACTGGVLVDGGYVEVTGSLGGGSVVAETIRCRNEPDDARIERRGVAGAVDTTSSTFELATNGNASVTVRFDEATRFEGVTALSLVGARLRVEGRISRGVLLARTIAAL